MSEEGEKREFHYGFFGGMRCRYYGFSREVLDLNQEVELGGRPLRVDMALEIYVEGNLFPNAFGRGLKKYNIFEYKGPGDSLSIDDICKVLAYAFAYKSNGKTVDALPLDEISVFFFCYMYPREAFAKFEKMGFSVSETGPGIYCLKGIPSLSVRVLLIPQLPGGFEELKILAPAAKKEDVLKVLDDASKHQDQGYLENIKAVLRISMAANPELYEEIREERTMMDVFERIFAKELKAERLEGKREGKREGLTEGVRLVASRMLDQGMPLEQISALTMMPVEAIMALRGGN